MSPGQTTDTPKIGRYKPRCLSYFDSRSLTAIVHEQSETQTNSIVQAYKSATRQTNGQTDGGV